VGVPAAAAARVLMTRSADNPTQCEREGSRHDVRHDEDDEALDRRRGAVARLGAAGLTPARAHVAQDATGKIDMNRTSIRSDRQAVAAQYLKLTEAEGKKFWPIYNEYQADITKENDKLVTLLTDLLTADEVSDEKLNKSLDEYTKIEK
jgi:hypothetical protein